MVLGKLDIHMQQNETESLSSIIHRNLFKIDWRLKHKTWNHNIPEKTKGKLLDVGLGNDCGLDTKIKDNKSKNKQMGFVYKMSLYEGDCGRGGEK